MFKIKHNLLAITIFSIMSVANAQAVLGPTSSDNQTSAWKWSNSLQSYTWIDNDGRIHYADGSVSGTNEVLFDESGRAVYSANSAGPADKTGQYAIQRPRIDESQVGPPPSRPPANAVLTTPDPNAPSFGPADPGPKYIVPTNSNTSNNNTITVSSGNNAVVTNSNSSNIKQCDRMAVIGPSKPKNCYDRDGNYVDSNGNVTRGNDSALSNALESISNANNGVNNGAVTVTPGNNEAIKQCDRMAVIGPSKPKNCYDRNGNYVDSNGNVTGSAPVVTPTPNTGTEIKQCDRMAVIGPSKPKNCYDSNGNYVDANGNVTSNNNTEPKRCDRMAVIGPSKPTNCYDSNGNYVDASGNVATGNNNTAVLNCGGSVSTNCYRQDSYIDASGVAHATGNVAAGMQENYSVLACEDVAQNLMLKGQADYLPLWEPPQNTIGDLTFAMEPRFNPTDLIFNNTNYGKGAVLLSSSTKVNPRTGAATTLPESPVVFNNCNITWIVPAWVRTELARRAAEANGVNRDTSGASFGPGKATLGPGGDGPDSVAQSFLGIDKDGYRRYADGSYDSNSSQEYRDYTIWRLENNTEGGFGMGWNDMEWNAGSGLWVPNGNGRQGDGPLY